MDNNAKDIKVTWVYGLETGPTTHVTHVNSPLPDEVINEVIPVRVLTEVPYTHVRSATRLCSKCIRPEEWSKSTAFLGVCECQPDVGERLWEE